jgi:20S proteasome alpha/beta subunit
MLDSKPTILPEIKALPASSKCAPISPEPGPLKSSGAQTMAMAGALLCLSLLAPLASAKSARKAPIRVKGSFVIAAVCKDGIIVASDSRGTLKNRQGQRIAYYDVNQKIFPIGNSVIADTGYASLNDPKVSFLSALMSDFAGNPRSHAGVEQLPTSYFKFVNATLPADGADSAKVQTLMFAGYSHGKPVLCIYKGESSRRLVCRSSGYFDSPSIEIAGLKQVASLSFDQAARVMRAAISNYATAISPGPVGGPVVVRVITPSRSQWWGSHPRWPNWSSFEDLSRDYQASRIPFHLLPGADKADLDALVEEGAAWARLGRTQ